LRRRRGYSRGAAFTDGVLSARSVQPLQRSLRCRSLRCVWPERSQQRKLAGTDPGLAEPQGQEIVRSPGTRGLRYREAARRGSTPRPARASHPAADHVQKHRQLTNPGPAERQVEQRYPFRSGLAPRTSKDGRQALASGCKCRGRAHCRTSQAQQSVRSPARDYQPRAARLPRYVSNQRWNGPRAISSNRRR
jgi:hypothetical protein